MEITGKKLAIGIAGIFVVGVAAGHWTVPLLVKETKTLTSTEKKIDEVKKDFNTNKDNHTKTVITETEFPGGKKQKVTEITQDQETHSTLVTDNKSKDSTASTEVDTKTVKKELGLNLSFMVGPDFSYGISSAFQHMCYGGQVNKEIVGPLTLGVWGTSCRQGGLELGLQF